MLLSVIVPVYNTERYLAGCLDSILGQTLKDMEIICVDDGSEDGSPEILKSYAVRDHRIRVIQKENGGLVSARKAGVRAAEGKYIGYVDRTVTTGLSRRCMRGCADMHRSIRRTW